MRSWIPLVLVLSLVAVAASDGDLLDRLPLRNIGPANMGGRIVDLAVVESDPNTMYVAAATGGLWKTTNDGDSWTAVFDQQPTLSLGAVAVAPSNPRVVWVGAGESNARNSVSWGDGVYRSTDGGQTWKHLGLKETRHIGRVAVDPRDPDTAYVAALGRIWGANPERGVFKTNDGGKTWQHVLALDADTGCIDVVVDPSEPDVVYAAAYCVRRDGFSGGNPVTQLGDKAGLYKSTDAGKTWAKMTNGLPTGKYGRCGLSVYRKDPRILYAVVQAEKTPVTVKGATPKANTGDVERGGLFRSDDQGKSWRKINDVCPRPFYYGQVRVDPTDDQRVYVLGTAFYVSSDGGKTFATGARGVHSDHHAMWINPRDPNHLILGNDGGLYFSRNRERTWEPVRNLALGQFYAIGVDTRTPYRVYGGLQDNGSWGGPSATQRADGITLNDWRRVAGADGFYVAADPSDPDTVYAEGQYGRLQRANVKGGGGKGKGTANKSIQPKQQGKTTRYNWSSPLVLSVHNPKTLYFGGNVLFKSINRGDTWTTVSSDLTRGTATSPSYANTLSTIAESPLKAGLLWVGTDDGRIHVSRDDGMTWTDVSTKVPGVPQDRHVTRIECSHFAEGTAYLTLDRHRNDDVKPYLFRTTDYGETWTSLVGDLPGEAPLHVVRESSRNKDLLFVGTELGLYVTFEGGLKWHRVRQLPPVPVHDLVIHPRERELVVGTHGRSIYVMDVAPLEQMTAAVRGSKLHLFDVKPAIAFEPAKVEAENVTKRYVAANPAYGATITYFVGAATKEAKVTIVDKAGNAIATMAGSGGAGLQQMTWNLRGNGSALVPVGEYVVKVEANGETRTGKLRVEAR